MRGGASVEETLPVVTTARSPGRGQWDADALLDGVRDHVVDHLGHEEGVRTMRDMSDQPDDPVDQAVAFAALRRAGSMSAGSGRRV